MKVLVISSYVPYPLYSGGQVRLYNLMRELSSKHEITLICEKRFKQKISREDIAALHQICKKVIVVPAPKQWSMKNILKAGLSPHSFLFTGHTHKIMQKKIREVVQNEHFDIIHVETFYVMQNLPGDMLDPRFESGLTKNKIPVVLAEHNIEYQVYERFMHRAPKVIRPLLALDIAKIKKEEERSWRMASQLIAVSEEDRKVMQQKGFEPVIVANGVNTDQFTYKNLQKSFAAKEKKILFIGDFKWVQNRDTVAWIIKEIWPKIKEKVYTVSGAGNIKLWIVGRMIPESVKALSNDPDILFDEKNSGRPTHELFQEAAVLLAPIRVGGGTSYKILESMSCGTPVVITSLSANALQARDEKEVMVGDTAEELAQKTGSLLQNRKLYESLSKNGRSFIESHYTWKEISHKLEEVYKSVSLQ